MQFPCAVDNRGWGTGSTAGIGGGGTTLPCKVKWARAYPPKLSTDFFVDRIQIPTWAGLLNRGWDLGPGAPQPLRRKKAAALYKMIITTQIHPHRPFLLGPFFFKGPLPQPVRPRPHCGLWTLGPSSVLTSPHF